MSEQTTDVEIKRAAQLSLIEISIGSLGHGFKIPLTGQILSLNQLAFLLNANNRDQLPTSSSFEISSIAAVMKSFSPAGQKLGPMFSIAMQGFLFWIFNSLFRKNIVGQLIGAFFLSLWSFVQPVTTYFLIYGFELVRLAEYYEKKLAQDFSFIHQSIIVGVFVVLVTKILAAFVLVIYSVRTKQEIQFVDPEKVQKLASAQSLNFETASSPSKAALKDMARPVFILSFILMMLFVWQIEGPFSQKIWLALRPLAIAYLLFYLIRSPFVAAKLFKLSQRSERFNKIYQKAKKAFALMNK
jgi:hypothetical protein